MPKKRRVLQAEAQERLEARAERSDAAQLARIVAKGHEHCKEAQRLRGTVKIGIVDEGSTSITEAICKLKMTDRQSHLQVANKGGK